MRKTSSGAHPILPCNLQKEIQKFQLEGYASKRAFCVIQSLLKFLLKVSSGFGHAEYADGVDLHVCGGVEVLSLFCCLALLCLCTYA